MEYQVKEALGRRYVWLPPGGSLLQSQQDGLDVIAACFQERAELLMIAGERLSPDFGRLATGLAGAVLQKLGQYRIKTALVLDPAQARGKFADFLAEANRGAMFRAYPTQEEAERWLLG